MSKKISVVIPCFNEEANIEEMVNRLTSVLDSLNKNYEYDIIFRDNCSTDNSVKILRRIANENKLIKVIVNARNYGVGGRKNSLKGRVDGDIVIFLACDLQEPPELIPEFIKGYEEGYEAVMGVKIGSEEGVKYQLRQIFYSIIDRMSPVPQYRNLSGISLISKRLLDLMWSTNRAEDLRFFLADVGCDIKKIEYKQKKRKHGKSSYNIWRYLSFAIKSMISTSNTPLRLATVSGCIGFGVSLVAEITFIILQCIFRNNYLIGLFLIITSIFFVGSILLLFLGIIGEYVGAVLDEVRPSNPPLVRELINFDESEDNQLYKTVDTEK